MPYSPAAARAANLHRAATALAAYVLAGGLVSFLGWALNRWPLTDWYGNGISIQPNATVCATLAGMGLLLSLRGHRRLAAAAGAAVATIGLATLLQYATGIDLGIDRLLMFGREWGRVGVIFPGRMGPPGSLSWTLFGMALALATAGGAAGARMASGLAMLTSTIAALSIIGYLIGVGVLYTVPYLTVIALQTATFILAVSLGIMAGVPEHGLTALLLRDDAAGLTVRRVLPAAVVGPLAVGWLGLLGHRAGLYDIEFAVAASTIWVMLLLVALLWWTAKAIARLEDARKAELAATRLLQSIGAKLVRSGELEPLLQEILAAAATIAGTEAGRIQLVDPETGRLDVAVHHGLGDGVGEDGMGTVHSTPLVSRGGSPLGSLDNHYRSGQRPSEQALRYLDLLARMAADLVERKRAEDALREADRRKDEFLATLAHELRNPLAPIGNAVQVLRLQGTADPSSRRAHETIDRQLRHLVRLVDDLLEVGRITRGRIELKRERVDLQSVVAHAIETNRPLIEAAGHHLTVDLPPAPIFLDADPVRLAQVFSNLLNNACKFTAPGGRIAVLSHREDGEVVVTVTDSGAGIPPRLLASVFGLFAQVERPIDRSVGGLGIGLHLAKRLVELHGGTVVARSEGEGKGSELVVRLPVLPGSPAVAEARAEPAGDRRAAARRILVVDDNRDSTESLSLLLQLGGHETEMAHEGGEAIEKAQAWHPDVILLDLGLPRMNGYDACRAIRRLPEGKDIRIIALTGWGQEQDRLETARAGFDAHLVKPVDMAALGKLLGDGAAAAGQS
jgi:signal transduction histidine kinase/CheY-like chemotaxis protein